MGSQQNWLTALPFLQLPGAAPRPNYSSVYRKKNNESLSTPDMFYNTAIIHVFTPTQCD